MKLSVIIPAYNAEKTLEKCLDSILNQTVGTPEVIVINDGSTDRTEEILKQYPVVFRTVENGGQGRARNIGLDLANGDYIGFVDSDDWIDPQMYEKLISAAEKTDSDLVLCDALAHFPDGKTEPERIWREDRKMAAAGFANNKLFRRELVKDIRFPEGLWYEDAEFTAIALHRAKRVEHLPEALYHYRRGYPSTMNNQNALKNLDILEVMEHLEDELCPEDRDDFEFLVINHVLLDTMNRLNAMEDSPDKRMVMQHMREYVRTAIPKLDACASYRAESRNRRLIMRLHYDGLSGLAKTLLKMKNG